MTVQLGNAPGFVDKRQDQNDTADSITAANYADEAALDTRLAAADAATYTAAYLAKMTHNDKVYALRTLDDAASI